MSAVRIITVFMGLTLLAGCSRESKPPQPQSREQLMGRFLAACKVDTSVSGAVLAQENALKTIAVGAADSGVAEVVIKAFERMNPSSVCEGKEELAGICALKLAKRGDTEAATAVAEIITDRSKKNEVLLKIARDSR